MSVAYKNVIGALRASWRIISTLEAKDSDEAKKNNAGTSGKKEKGLSDLMALKSDITIFKGRVFLEGGVFGKRF